MRSLKNKQHGHFQLDDLWPLLAAVALAPFVVGGAVVLAWWWW